MFFFEMKLANHDLLEPFLLAWGIVPARLFSDFRSEAVTLISSTFLHGGWAHIIGNMMYLYIFGDNVEDRLGHFRYLVFYVCAGVIAGLCQSYMSPASNMPLIGASGAIAGVLGAYFFFFPKARVLTLIPLGFFSRMIEVPAFLFLGFWFVMQTFSGSLALSAAILSRREIGGVAWWAHAGGFLGGLILGPVLGGFSRSKSRSFF